ncbi:hypothetical protein F2Q69_00043893 [Brassica cretica]|uniref:Uncharacterized protein n=2 Tax=Brassica cretica TaxID=69181 RepID=A0A8S9NJ77_BRACR|nr:hypothetical protein F2Q69_00043893 [Brassica cretica]KAF3567578.1 hypothetical protein DY000_02017504 [Brassica cretica]
MAQTQEPSDYTNMSHVTGKTDSISIYSNNLKQTVDLDVRLTLKMRKSPWIELEKSNATGLNDQKANIEAGESEADDKDKSDS